MSAQVLVDRNNADPACVVTERPWTPCRVSGLAWSVSWPEPALCGSALAGATAPIFHRR